MNVISADRNASEYTEFRVDEMESPMTNRKSNVSPCNPIIPLQDVIAKPFNLMNMDRPNPSKPAKIEAIK